MRILLCPQMARPRPSCKPGHEWSEYIFGTRGITKHNCPGHNAETASKPSK